MIHAIIDIGSSTVRLAIYLIEPDHVEMLMKKKHLLGLASYLEEGRMSETGILKTIKVLDDFKRFLHDLGINAITAFTTAALRNSANSKEAVQSISVATGIPIRVISGDEEATYDFIGATHGMKSREGLLVDIGGASTEIVSFKDKKIRNKISLPMGSLLFASQYVQELLPGREEADEMRRAADDILKSAPAFLGLEHRWYIQRGLCTLSCYLWQAWR
jgi:exopolyphosphatase/guanosine-5'-triphosphate,3'-diphosphate pyrophosphatase